MKVTIYHNPRCSKSRAALQLLRERDLEVEVVEYLEAGLDAGVFAELARRLGGDPVAMIRCGDDAFAEAGIRLSPTPDAAEVAEILAEHPRLLQRPIVVAATGAVIGRPPEKVLDLL